MAKNLWLPIAASEHAGAVDFMMLALHVLMLAIFVGWAIFFVYCLVRFRRSKHAHANPAGTKGKPAKYVEAVVVVAEAILLIGFSVPFWAAEVDALPKADENPFDVRVVAQQFVWNVHYPGPDGVYGRTAPELVDEEVGNPLGLDATDPRGNDDIITMGDLTLPVNRPIVVHLSSKDVIHSFFVPELRVKRDAIPGMSIAVPFTPTLTTQELREKTGDETRNFEIACAQLCGNSHYRMKGRLTVLSAEEMDQWLEEKSSANTEEDDFFN